MASTNTVAIAAYVTGGVLLTTGNKGRMAAQAGVGQTSAVKTVLTGAALVATGYSRILGQKVMNAGTPPVQGATEPGPATPDDVAGAQRQLKALQWAIPALTGALLVVNARMGEQQRPQSVVSGVLHRLNPAA